MIAAVIVAVGIMFVASGPVAKFVSEHPTTKMLALAFLLMIGVSLVAFITIFATSAQKSVDASVGAAIARLAQ